MHLLKLMSSISKNSSNSFNHSSLQDSGPNRSFASPIYNFTHHQDLSSNGKERGETKRIVDPIYLWQYHSLRQYWWYQIRYLGSSPVCSTSDLPYLRRKVKLHFELKTVIFGTPLQSLNFLFITAPSNVRCTKIRFLSFRYHYHHARHLVRHFFLPLPNKPNTSSLIPHSWPACRSG